LSVLTEKKIEITANAPQIPVGTDAEAASVPTPVECTGDHAAELVVRGWAEPPTFRFSGGFADPGGSITGRLTGPHDALDPLGVQDQPHVSTAVV
jgi:hypothetical protein